ncbi:hypothetical protein V8G54_001837 [Vigna mungo]|uniref:Cytokinin dehydrogenase 1 FAD/cytokinin binding domain-containing protein n=1 Tax=Vigna mungo TaxID=3915 RepID=A0AAQ3P865_VIGMU
MEEHLISLNGRNDTIAADYVEGLLLLNQPPLDLSLFPAPDQPRCKSFGGGVEVCSHVYVRKRCIIRRVPEQSSCQRAFPSITRTLGCSSSLAKPLSFQNLESQISMKDGIPNYLTRCVKGIILKQNLPAGVAIIYPMNRSMWNDKMSAVTPNEDVFYIVSLLHSTGFDKVEEFRAQNQQIMKFCKDTGIKIKQYLPRNKTRSEWIQHFGSKWKTFQERKNQFDPNRILSPGQRIFNKI